MVFLEKSALILYLNTIKTPSTLPVEGVFITKIFPFLRQYPLSICSVLRIRLSTTHFQLYSKTVQKIRQIIGNPQDYNQNSTFEAFS